MIALADSLDEVPRRGERHLEGDALDHHAFAADALVPRGEHPGVVLVGDDHLVATLQVDSQDQGLHPLRGVSGNGELFRVAAELTGQVAADALDARLQDVPHMQSRHLVGEAQVADHLVEHVAGTGSDPAVVEVDPGPVDIESPLDLRPVVFLSSEFVRRSLSRVFAGPRGPRDRIAAEHGRGHSPGQANHEVTSTFHPRLPFKFD